MSYKTYNGKEYTEDEWFCFVNGIKTRNVDPIGTYRTETSPHNNYYDLKEADMSDTMVKVGRHMTCLDICSVLVKNESGDLSFININRGDVNP